MEFNGRNNLYKSPLLKDADEISQHSDDGESVQSASVEHHASDKSKSHSPTNSASSDDEGGGQSHHSRSESRSPNLRIDDEVHSRANSASGNSDNNADSDGSMKSPSRSRSGSRSSKSRAHSSKSRSQTPKSRSQTPKSHLQSPRSLSKTPQSRSQSPKSGSQTPKSVLQSPVSRSQSPIEKKNQKKKHKLISSESESEEESKMAAKLSGDENNREQSEKLNAQDIFGDADDISDEDDKSVASPNKRLRSRSSSRHSNSEHSRSRSSSPSNSQSPPESTQSKATVKETENEIPETRIEVEVPRILTNLGKEIHFVKLPNFLSVESRPFDAETYEDEIDEEETMDEEGRQRIKLKVSNTIRWRESMNNDGKIIKESNARFVRWSDGSHTLHLGNEMFDVYRQPLLGDHNHLFIRQGTGLQGQSVFRTKLTFRPHSTESFTHKKMTMSLADRSQKTSGIKILTQVGKDPTADRLFNLKKEEEKLRQATRSQHKAQPKKKKAADVTSSAYNQDDGSDDENTVSLSEIKNKYKKIARAPAGSTVPDQKASGIYSSDDDDGSDFERRRKKIDKNKIVKALRDSDSESGDNVESDAEAVKSKTNDSNSEDNESPIEND